MPDLFGIDIAQEVLDAIDGAGGVLDGTLYKVTPGTRTAGALAGGTNPTRSRPYRFKGFYDDQQLLKLDASLVKREHRAVLILGASLPSGITPAPNDEVLLEGDTTVVDRIIERDPAAATWVLMVRRT